MTGSPVAKDQTMTRMIVAGVISAAFTAVLIIVSATQGTGAFA